MPAFLANTDFDDVDTLTSAVLEAVGDRKGAVASVMNAMIGSCILHATTTATASGNERPEISVTDRVNSLMLAYEELEQTRGITPDVVSFSLAYTAFLMDEDFAQGQSRGVKILEQAQRRAKKLAGARRRKQLVSFTRKPKSTFVDKEEHLKGLLGDDFQVLLETDDFAVINKPSGVPCFHKKVTTAGKIKKSKKENGTASGTPTALSSIASSRPDISLEDAVVSCSIPLSTLNPDALGLVHRLDRGSSGCMVLAKTDVAHARLVADFFLRRTTKIYSTLVEYDSSSSAMAEDGGIIELPVDGRPARSRYRVLDRYESLNVAMLEFEIFTGRKHQIRVHAARGLGSPVLNDGLYSDRRSQEVGSAGRDDAGQRFFLHSSKLKIPTFDIDVEAPIPAWWDLTIPSLGGKRGE
jgi:23S rRNA-/tRNA-specific pseudouridylate synthase